MLRGFWGGGKVFLTSVTRFVSEYKIVSNVAAVATEAFEIIGGVYDVLCAGPSSHKVC